MSQPKNWPQGFPYLKSPLHAKDITPAHLSIIRQRPQSSSSSSSLPIISTAQTQTPNTTTVKILPIRNPFHPAYNQAGLFAAQDLAPGTFILAYLGRVHTSTSTDTTSDYDLWLDKEADVAVDAAREGNEGRFVNDFRGVAERANAEFRTVWCERWGELCVGVWVIGGGGSGKKKGGGIKKGDEILVSYGKGFWDGRRGEQS
jgi:nuclear pore complex protein Nup98-Nup96